MPIFEYRCMQCGDAFETLQARGGEAAPSCPRCGAAGAERLLSVFAVTRPSTPTLPGPCGSRGCACRRS
jgi:putative FmdB family regulatory protein